MTTPSDPLTPRRAQRRRPPGQDPPPVDPATLRAAEAELRARLDAADAPAAVPPPVTDPPPLSGFEAERLAGVVAELSRRQAEALLLYEPLPVVEAFHASAAAERVLRGSNRAGKSLGAAVEVARACTGNDPNGKYPKENGRAHLVGKSLDHCGKVMWEALGRAGAFKMVRDPASGAWRAYRPWEDAANGLKPRPAPPLIPRRLIKEISWENKKQGNPRLVRLKNGWELHFYSAEGEPPQGVKADLVWFDEEIPGERWYGEMAARLIDCAGSFIWSATPQAATEQLYALHVRSVDEERLPVPERKCREFVVLLADNPHVDEGQKRDLAAKLTDEERRVRIEGEFAITGFRVYPEFSIEVHGCDPFPVPADWTLYAVVDPGRQVCAVLFAGVPPGDRHVYLFDELYIRHCDAEKFGEQMAHRCQGLNFEAFVIDHQAGRVNEIGSGLNVEEQYAAALKRHRVKSRRTGCGFLWGSSDVEAGILAFRQWLKVRPDGTTRLRVFREKLPGFGHEVKYYHYQRRNLEAQDKPVKKNDHLMDCSRYLAMLDPHWVKPRRKGSSWAVQQVKAKRERQREREGNEYVRLGPAG